MPSHSFYEMLHVLPFRPGSYQAVLDLQHRRVDQRAAGIAPDAILLGEHERVITLGRGTRAAPGPLPIPAYSIERGGEATWHGPGQLVAYPILHLGELSIGVREYLRGLEQAVIEALAAFGLDAVRRPGATGVWLQDRKIASLGVAVRRRVSFHGLALNVAPDLADFHLIRPCGFAPEVMTSMAEWIDPPPALEVVGKAVLDALVRVFDLPPPVWVGEPGTAG